MGIRWRAAKVASCARRTVNKGPVATKSASGRSRSNGAKAAPISRPFLALRTWICRPMARAADSACSNVVLAVVVLVGSTSTATRAAAGTNSRRSCNRFITSSTEKMLIPVKFPPGRARLVTRPSLAGSSAATKRIGIVAVVALAANAAGTVAVAITATRRRARSSASAGNLSISFWAERYKTDTFSPSTKPACLRPCRNPRSCSSSIDRGARNPITGIDDCCACAASDHVAAPPSNEMKARRLTDAPQAELAYHGEGGSVHHGESGSSMSGLGLQPCLRNVRFTSKSGHGSAGL